MKGVAPKRSVGKVFPMATVHVVGTRYTEKVGVTDVLVPQSQAFRSDVVQGNVTLDNCDSRFAAHRWDVVVHRQVRSG